MRPTPQPRPEWRRGPPPRHRGAGAHRARGAPTPTSSSPPCSRASRLSPEDRHLVTELAYGATRQRRALDHLVDGFLLRPVDGAHPRRAAGRRLPARHAAASRPTPRCSPPSKPSPARPASWSTPSCAAWPSGWRRDRPAGPTRPPGSPIPTGWWHASTTSLGVRDARAALEAMNRPARVTERRRRLHPGPRLAVGGRARRRAARPAGGGPLRGAGRQGDVPGRARARRSPRSTAAAARAGLVVANGRRLRPWSGSPRSWPTAAGRRCDPAPSSGSWSTPPAAASAPCGGARTPAGASSRTPPPASPSCSWQLLGAAAELLAPGGVLVYSVCTLDRAETLEVDEAFAAARPDLRALPAPAAAVAPLGTRRAAPAPGGGDRRHVRSARAADRPREPGRTMTQGQHGHDADGAHGARDADGPPGRPRPGARSRGAEPVARRCAPRCSTASDGVVAGTREDRSGAALVEALRRAGFEIAEHRAVADGVESVAGALSEMAAGFSGAGRDHRRHRLRPPRPDPRGHPPGGRAGGARAGRGDAPRRPAGPRAPVAGHRRHRGPGARSSTRPGSPAGAVESLEAVLDVLPHALRLLADEPTSH